MGSDIKYFVGVDIGSVSAKAVLLGGERLLAWELSASGGSYSDAARRVLDSVLSRHKLKEESLSGIAATGIGSENIPFQALKVSDVSCQARGCRFLFPGTRTVIDIGGQFTKVARITPNGHVADFIISEKCATGSGRFLQVISRILQVKIDEIGPLSLKSKSPVKFSTNCAVFAESETVSRIAEGASVEDILAGVHRAMSAKVSMLVHRVRPEPEVILTGGGGADAGLASAVSNALGMDILVPENPRITAALGAACLASDKE